MIKLLLLSTAPCIFILLGFAHLYYTFISNKFSARDTGVTEGMKKTSPLLTGQTSMWNAWIGFNGSHSLGAIFFGGINLVLTIQFYDIIQTSLTIQLLNILVCFAYLALAVKYWFRIPIAGIALATLCFLLGYCL